MSEILRAAHDVTLSYRRSVGGADSVFLTGLARREIWASTGADGTVAVPPVDWDPATGAASGGFVRLGEKGTVRTWTWVAEPPAGHPMTGPHALALIVIDGADTALLHYVDPGDEAAMHTGMVVRAEWREERVGSVLDIRAFVPAGAPEGEGEGGGGPAGDRGPAGGGETLYGSANSVAEPPFFARSDTELTDRYRVDEPDAARAAATTAAAAAVTVDSNITIHYGFEPGVALTGFLRALADGRIEGGRCPSCAGVYVPPRPRCPACRIGPMAPAPVAEVGTVVACTEVHIPFPGLTLDLPFTCAWIRLDGADVPFAHLLGELGPDGARVGQRVEAVWAGPGARGPTWESIRWFRPVGGGPVGGGAT